MGMCVYVQWGRMFEGIFMSKLVNASEVSGDQTRVKTSRSERDGNRSS